MYTIETANLYKKYGDKVIVNNVNLKVKKGTVFGFLGKNGAGKSTFINMLTGLIYPTSGTFKLFGKTDLHKNKLQKKIGVLPDYSTFYDDLTAVDHLKYFSSILGASLSNKEILNILSQVGLEDASNIKAKHFSFGMKKKLGIAQTLINDPDLIFLDEPTSGVDASSALNIHLLIQNIARKGTTVFLTSHNLNEVEKLCDEIAIMNKGIIQARGSMKELRSLYQNNITVHIKHGEITKENDEWLKSKLKSIGNIVEWTSNDTVLIINNEMMIPQINRLFLQLDVDIFRINVDEPSLEEIFLNIGTE